MQEQEHPFAAGRAAPDEPAAPQAGGLTRASPARPLGPAELRTASCDLLGRPPLRAEREAWVGKARHELLEAWVGGLEFWENWLEEQLYYFFLIDNFRPENAGVLALPAELAAGRLNVREATQRIALSSSFDQRNPGADTFVTVVMEQLAGMTVQRNVRELEIGKAIYDGASGVFLGRTGKRQADIIDIALRQRSFTQTFVAREYVRFFGVAPPAKELASWVNRLHQTPFDYAALVRDWLLSVEWEARVRARLPMSNRLFARALYVDLLDRLPAAEEARRMRSALDGMSDSGPLRAVLARILIDSGSVKLPDKRAIGDPRRWIWEQFRVLLGREASEDELNVFVEAFAAPECRPATVLYALVTHPQYQSY